MMNNSLKLADILSRMFRPRFAAALLMSLLICLAPLLCRGQTRRGSAGKQTAPTLQWQFDIKEGEYGVPSGKVYLLVGARKILVLPDASEFYSVIERKDYRRSRIPRSALTAIFGWYAGQGKQLYVISRKNRLVVFIKYFDEGSPDIPVQRLKTIRRND